jgi:hypothetical protein
MSNPETMLEWIYLSRLSLCTNTPIDKEQTVQKMIGWCEQVGLLADSIPTPNANIDFSLFLRGPNASFVTNVGLAAIQNYLEGLQLSGAVLSTHITELSGAEHIPGESALIDTSTQTLDLQLLPIISIADL